LENKQAHKKTERKTTNQIWIETFILCSEIDSKKKRIDK